MWVALNAGSASVRAERLTRYGDLTAQGMSQRQAAQGLDVPRSTLATGRRGAWRAWDIRSSWLTPTTRRCMRRAVGASSRTVVMPWRSALTHLPRRRQRWPTGEREEKDDQAHCDSGAALLALHKRRVILFLF
jgi:hypothetical protein